MRNNFRENNRIFFLDILKKYQKINQEKYQKICLKERMKIYPK